MIKILGGGYIREGKKRKERKDTFDNLINST
jgi:hypothetical protein